MSSASGRIWTAARPAATTTIRPPPPTDHARAAARPRQERRSPHRPTSSEATTYAATPSPVMSAVCGCTATSATANAAAASANQATRRIGAAVRNAISQAASIAGSAGAAPAMFRWCCCATAKLPSP